MDGGNPVLSPATLIGHAFAACRFPIDFQADFAPSDPSWVWFPVSSDIMNLGELWQPCSSQTRGGSGISGIKFTQMDGVFS